MKNLIMIFLMVACPLYSNAQSRYSHDKILSGKTTFLISRPNFKTNRFLIRNSKNVLFKKAPDIPSSIKGEYLNYIYTSEDDREKVRNIIINAIGEKYAELKNEQIIIQYYIDRYGVIKEVSFALNDNTRVLPDNLRDMEQAVKEKYIFNVDSLKLTGIDFITFFWPMQF